MINPRFFEQIKPSELRYEECEAKRKAIEQETGKRKGGERAWQEIDTPERFIHRLKSKGFASEAREIEQWTGEEPLGFDPFERILEDNELTSATTLYEGAALTHSTGRVVIRDGAGRVAGYGTGFLVSPVLLLTNNHVLESAAEARPSTVEFFYWEDRKGRTGQRVEFKLDPGRFFETDRGLDFSLVAVEERSENRRLKDLGWTPLIGDSGKATVGEAVNIIQHPRGEDQKVVLRQNKILDVVGHFLHYEADTEPGSSGSPVYNVDWQLAALHHSAVPKRNEDGDILLRGDVVWNGDRAFIDRIQWVANEGVRISSIVAELRDRSGDWSASKQALFEGCFENAPDFDTILPGVGRPRGTGPDAGRRGDGDDSLAALLRRLLGRLGESEGDEDRGLLEAAMDRDYDNRDGFDPAFLGYGRFRIDLPELRQGSTEQDGTTLDYHTFTVRMNPARRLARYTASNIHGRKLHNIRRKDGRTNWVFDTRIPSSEQIGNDLYSNNLIDKGHMVRRLDAAWGNDRDQAMAGNDDTFHYTNSSPQHKHLNEDDESWAGLEDHYLDNARAANRKLSVFTGPVFRADDPLFDSPDGESARIPRQFWKIIAYRSGGRIVADGYLLSQRDILASNMNLEVLEAFGGDDFGTFQVSIADIEALTDLDFSDLRAGDTFEELFGEGLEEASERAGGLGLARQIRSLKDIRLDRR